MNDNRSVYQCNECGHECTEDEMQSDACPGIDPEPHSNHICPSCETWHTSLEKGWTCVKEGTRLQ